MLQALFNVDELLSEMAVVLPEHAKGGLPVVRLELVQALVVEDGGHFSDGFLGVRTGDGGLPFLLLAGLEFVAERFPFHGEVFVGPRHIHLVAGKVGAVFADHRDVHGESAPHGFIDHLLELELSEAALGPEALKDLAAVFHLDERAGFLVATAPQGGELAAGFHGPGGRFNQVRNLDGQLAGLRIHHLNRSARGDFFAESILCFHQHAVCALFEMEVELGLATIIGGESLFGNDLAQFPGVDVGSVGFWDEFRGKAAVAMWHHGVPVAVELGALHLFGLLECIDFQSAFGGLANAIECGGVEGHSHSLVLLLPIRHGEVGLQSGVAEGDAVLVTPGFAGGVGDVGIHGVPEFGFVLGGD